MKTKQWALLVVVVLVVALGYWLMGREGGFPTGNSVYPTPTPSSSPAAKAPAKSGAKVSPAPSRPYGDLVKEYEGRRIQFDQRCQVVPNDPTYKNGSSVMLDNRSNNPVTVKVGNTSYSLAGYGYQIINLSSTSLPKELVVSCGSAGNVGKILLQANLNQ
ncbi:MAG: hypothetical protein HYT67_02315 [Candidatus Yanofskybacteria bacterium]|nr:hypothetical protein [Candidatus Yanofskybacteria bacterium]